jgi:Sulfotransferase family
MTCPDLGETHDANAVAYHRGQCGSVVSAKCGMNRTMTLWKVARPAAWAAFRAVSRLYILVSRREYCFIFILGHMRSGSSLLAHILASHPEIAGAGETHISYQTRADLSKLVLKTGEFLHRPVLSETYIVDQINHPYITDEVLGSTEIYRCIILIREPEATIKSTIKMLECQEQEALEVYIKRLDELTRYGRQLGARAVLVQYDDLVDRPEETLAALTSFLGLRSPLTPNYTTHRMTGRIGGYGDPSDNIKTGQIIRTASHGIAISNDTLAAATRAFHKCRAELQSAAVQPLSPAAVPDRHAAMVVSKE